MCDNVAIRNEHVWHLCQAPREMFDRRLKSQLTLKTIKPREEAGDKHTLSLCLSHTHKNTHVSQIVHLLWHFSSHIWCKSADLPPLAQSNFTTLVCAVAAWLSSIPNKSLTGTGAHRNAFLTIIYTGCWCTLHHPVSACLPWDNDFLQVLLPVFQGSRLLFSVNSMLTNYFLLLLIFFLQQQWEDKQ